MVFVLPPCPTCSEAKCEIFHLCFLLECSFFKQDHSGAAAREVRASFRGFCAKDGATPYGCSCSPQPCVCMPILTIYLQMEGELLLIIFIGSPNGVKSSFLLLHPHQHQSCLVPEGDRPRVRAVEKYLGTDNAWRQAAPTHLRLEIHSQKTIQPPTVSNQQFGDCFVNYPLPAPC